MGNCTKREYLTCRHAQSVGLEEAGAEAGMGCRIAVVEIETGYTAGLVVADSAPRIV